MSVALKLSQEIEKEKQNIIKKFEATGSLLNKEVFRKSQQLDRLIVSYMRVNIDERKNELCLNEKLL